MSFATDRYVMPRQGASNLTATEAAGTNVALVPPGWYTYDIAVPIAPTGTSPTLVVTWSEAADGSTWTAINPQSTATLNGAATGIQHMSGKIRVTKNPSSQTITANVTAICTVGGTTPSWGKTVIALTPANTSGYAGAP